MTQDSVSPDLSDDESGQLIAHYKRIIEISQQLSSTYDHVSLLRKIVFAAKELINTEVASILLLDDATGQLRFMMSTNIKPHEMEELVVPLDSSIAGWIFTHGEPRVIENPEQSKRVFRGVDTKIDFHTRNLLGVPMRTHKDVIGVLEAVNKHDGEQFNDQDIVTLRTLAGQAAMALENARLFQQSDFISEMVHELRTPLMALKASTALLQRTDLPQDKHDDIVGTMKGETNRLIALTNDFLDVARLESGRVTLDIAPFSVHDLLAETAGVVAHQAAEKGVTIEVDDDGYIVEADYGKIKQVLLNLMTNAIKYNKPNGSVFMRTQTIEDQGTQFLQISVADTGYGIPREHQKNMFQKFFRVPTTENVARGTGLGLAISKSIVEAHGGRIWVESEENIGSTFALILPLTRG